MEDSKELILIANSGIQLNTSKVTIDLNSQSRYYFHEWFDEEEVQTNLEFAYYLRESENFVRLADMESCGFVDRDGKLRRREDEVLANPNIDILYHGDIDSAKDIFSIRLNDERHCKINNLVGRWIPLPYYETDNLGNCKNGPYNWVRCKLLPRQSNDINVKSYDLLMAIDTRAVYDEPDDYVECPSFVRDTENVKNFKLSSDASGLLNFCSGKNTWIRSYLMEIVHGVTEIDDIQVSENEYKYSFLASYLMLIDYLVVTGQMPVISLVRDRGVSQIGVEMIIDIGNSRTAAILFEDRDFTKVKSLTLQNFSQPVCKNGELNRNQETFDMRLAFQKVSFGENLIGSEQFVWPSLVRLGKEAEYLTHTTVNQAKGDEVLSTYSSPKRYLWDEKPRTEEWRCVSGDATAENDEPIINNVSCYFRDDGSIDPDGYGVGLHYSRKSLMTFAFIEIISQAIMQLNSYEYREFHGRINTPRHLEKVILTCPTAMSKKEQLSLHGSLKDALFVLKQYNHNIDPASSYFDVRVVPDLSRKLEKPQWIFDEATCSQFVYLYGQFSETYLNNSKEFFEIYGKKRTIDNKKKDTVVIGSLDIGAGTSDIMVCQYEFNELNTSRLKPVPLFWDSFDYAGDDMMKVLIENVIIQGKDGIIEKELSARKIEPDRIRRMLYQFFGSDNNSLSFQDRIIRRDFNLQVCVPVMNFFLDLLSKGESYWTINYEDIFKDNYPSETVLEKFRQHFGFPLSELKWTYDSLVLTKLIEHSMNELLENIATIMYAHDCDIVILSGRPTSLPPIRDVFLRYFNMNPGRLVSLNKHRTGRWYPFADEFGFITNSKSVVPVGAMIGYLASNAGGLNNFSLDLSALGEILKPTTDFFVLNDIMVQKNKAFITPEKQTGEIIVNSFPAFIGSKQYDFSAYPVRPFYVLDINESNILQKIIQSSKSQPLNEGEKNYRLREYKDKLMSNAPLTFMLERPDYKESKEQLIISSVQGANGEDVPVGDFIISVQSLNDPDCYWLDSGAFNINIKA